MTHYMKAVQFFAENAGYCWTPGKETKRQGKVRCARALAKAEQASASNGWRVEWVEDPEPYQLGDAEVDTPKEVLGAVLRDSEGKQLASLWGIGDPTRQYARVVEAELALETMGELGQIGKHKAQ